MLVTFSVNGAGATTLTNFCETDFPYSAPEPRTRTLQSSRTTRRSLTGIREVSASTLLNAKCSPLLTGYEANSKIRAARTASYAAKPYGYIGQVKIDEDAEWVEKFLSGTLRRSRSGIVHHGSREPQPLQQNAQRSFASSNKAAFLHQPLIQQISAPPPQAPSSSPTTCIDPKVLDKNYVPEFQDSPIHATTLQPQVSTETYSFPQASLLQPRHLVQPPLGSSISYSAYQSSASKISWHHGRRSLVSGDKHQQRRIPSWQRQQSPITHHYLRQKSCSCCSPTSYSLKENETSFVRNIVLPELRGSEYCLVSCENTHSRSFKVNNYHESQPYTSPYHRVRLNQKHTQEPCNYEKVTLHIHTMEELAKDRGSIASGGGDEALSEMVQQEVKLPSTQHTGESGSPSLSPQLRRDYTAEMMDERGARIKITDHILLLHKFIKNLPSGRPFAPFRTEIFPDSEDCTKSKMKYKNVLAFHCTPFLKPFGRSETSGIYCIYTRKCPSNYEHLATMSFQEPARKKRPEDGETDLGLEAALVHEYSATAAKADGKDEWLSVRMPKKIVTLHGVDYQAEPTWDEVVGALKAEVALREVGWKWIGEPSAVPPLFWVGGAL